MMNILKNNGCKTGLIVSLLGLILATGCANPMTKAVSLGKLEKVQARIAKTGNPDETVDAQGNTLLHLAAANGKLEIVGFLMTQGAQPDSVNKSNWTPLHNAIGGGFDQITAALLEKGADPTKRTKEGWNLWHVCASTGKGLEIARSIGAGLDINQPDKDGTTPLMVAVCANATNAVEVLLRWGAIVNATNGTGWSALHYATAFRHGHIESVLKSSGANPNLADHKGRTPEKVRGQQDQVVMNPLLPMQMTYGNPLYMGGYYTIPGMPYNSVGVPVFPSDRNIKTDWSTASAAKVLDGLRRLEIATWRYQGRPGTHIGPSAQDFHAAFGLGESDREIAVVDGVGVSLAAVQALSDELAARDAKLLALEQELADLRRLITDQQQQSGRPRD